MNADAPEPAAVRNVEWTGPETLRRSVHVLFGVEAYLLPVIGWTACFVLACVAVPANKWLLPRLPWFKQVRDVARGDRGIWIYPLAVAVLLLVFKDRPVVAQAGWLALGVGDGLAPVVATFVRRGPTWPLRSDKRVIVSVGAGALAALAVLVVAPWPTALAAGFCGALADGLPTKIDDNVGWPVFASLGAFTAEALRA